MTGYLGLDRSEAEQSEFDEAGWLTVQVNGYGGAGLPGALAHAPFGFLGRPPDPDDDGACKVLVLNDGNEKHAIATVDLRALKKLPQVKKGGSMQFGSDGTFVLVDPEKHMIEAYVPVLFSGSTPTNAHSMTLGVDANDNPLISLVHALGMALVMKGGGKNSVVLSNKAGNVYLEINDEGGVLNGNFKLMGGLVAGDPAGAQPLALAPALITWAGLVTTSVNQLIATVAAILAKLNQLPPVSAIPPVAPPLAPLSASVAATKVSGA